MRILAIVGSLRASSYNAALARAAAMRAPEGVEIELYDRLGDIPPYDADNDGEETPEAVEDLAHEGPEPVGGTGRERLADEAAQAGVLIALGGEDRPGPVGRAGVGDAGERDDPAGRTVPAAIA